VLSSNAGVQAAAGVAFYVIAIFLGGELVAWLCRRLNLGQEEHRGLTGAGRYIGYFERFIVLSLVLVEEYQAITFIFAGKSIARFRSQAQVEYYLVGTLASLSWAIACGFALRWLVRF